MLQTFTHQGGASCSCTNDKATCQLISCCPELVAHECAVIGLEALVITIESGVHQVHKCAILVCFKQGISFATPDHLDDVPASALEEGLELLDDLAIAAHRAIQTLQVAVDYEGEVIQVLACSELEKTT